MKKRIMSLVLILCAALSLLPGTALAAAASGKCGGSASWSLDINGTLTITGSGAMYDYNTYGSARAPWYGLRRDITGVRIGDGITSTGNFAFYECENMTTAHIGGNVAVLSKGTFEDCENLSEVTIPVSVRTIEYEAFEDCDHLRSIQYAGTEAQWNSISIHSSNYSALYASGCRISCGGSADTPTLSSGQCGGGVDWALDRSGALSITGSGAMYDYNTYGSARAPWYGLRRDISSIEISGGVTRIGSFAFYDCENVTTVHVGGAAVIGKGAFEDCDVLSSIYLPDSLDVIEYDALEDCDSLRAVYYGGTEEQWNNINIHPSNNSALYSKKCRVYYDYSSASEEYTVTFNANGGKTPVPSKKTVANGEPYGELPVSARTGYTFTGWYTSRTGGSKVTEATTVSLTKNQTLYARWTKNAAAKKFTVTFSANGGKTPIPSRKTVTNGEPYGELPAPTRAGYTFAGWYTSRTGGVQVTEAAVVDLTARQTLYAHWTKEEDGNPTRTVTFDANGGTVLLQRKSVLRGSRYRDLPTPTRPDYHFAGWYTARSGGVRVRETSRVTQAGDHTLYARWSTAKVTVRDMDADRSIVFIPAYYELPLYSSQTTAAQAMVNPAKTEEYAVRCTKKVELSNGTERYYGSINGRGWWFQFTEEMDVD